jgi:hypothetical protein
LKIIPFDRLKPEKGIDYCRDHLRRKVKAGEFPKPVELSDRRIAWLEDEIDDYLASRPRRNGGPPVPPPHGSSDSPAAAPKHARRGARSGAGTKK